jgi:exosortase family protein XrtG
MSWPELQVTIAVYVGGLIGLHSRKSHLLLYVWGAFGFAFVAIQLCLLQGWDVALSAAEAQHISTIVSPLGVSLTFLDSVTVLVPDPTGWSSLRFSIECSTLIELCTFVGLMLYYPRLSLRKRWTYLAVGGVGTYLLNLLRVLIIVSMIVVWGKPVVPIAHAVVGRLVYFVGVVALYWFLLTRPTLALVHRSIETTGRAVR